MMLIEKAEEEEKCGKRKARGNEIVVKVVLIVQVLLCSVVFLKSSRGCPSLPEEEGRACRGDGGVKPEKRSF